ncbi:hypothetical protein KY308_03505 [Candidatus Woesearchaeota archaeon]|nr:hypothetical protein [Candidatus Woesearchaeota archaeon]
MKAKIYTAMIIILLALPAAAFAVVAKEKIDLTIAESASDVTIWPSKINASYEELIEQNIGRYNYLESSKYVQSYGTSYVASYNWQGRKDYYATAYVILFEDEEGALKYLKDKIKNSKKSRYIKNVGTYFLDNPSSKTFLWIDGNRAIGVSDYSGKKPTDLMLEYLKKYPLQLNLVFPQQISNSSTY